ncbi:MAG: hypothetical protein JWR42_421, partial [Marmoricola sp.]|nr:hypothetical protein [Marmoricola sp.]
QAVQVERTVEVGRAQGPGQQKDLPWGREVGAAGRWIWGGPSR